MWSSARGTARAVAHAARPLGTSRCGERRIASNPASPSSLCPDARALSGASDWQAHRCSKAEGCISRLAKEKPELLDELRQRLEEAAAAAAATEGRHDVLPERRSSKVRRLNFDLGKVSSSPAMEQALTAMADVWTGPAPPTPAADATAVWEMRLRFC